MKSPSLFSFRNWNSSYKYGLYSLFLTFVSLLILASSCRDKDYTQCNDPNALNYNKEAEGDEHCEYHTVRIQPRKISRLDMQMEETSGLVFSGDKIWTHNDRGHTNELYAIDTATGGVLQTMVLKDRKNHDWEDLAKSEDYIFVGDIGNNDGDRTNLAVYRVAKEAAQSSAEKVSVISEKIPYFYPNQMNFDPNKDHNFDCEALIYWNDYLYLFSKNRKDDRTQLYQIPARPSENEYAAEKMQDFKATGRITGATISEDKKAVILIGYNKDADVFLWYLYDFSPPRFLSGKKIYVNLGPFREIGQAEAVCYLTPERLLISSEKVKDLEPKLYEVKVADILSALD